MMNCVKSRGYIFAVCEDADDPYICGALHVERDDSSWVYESDEEAARAAERNGVKLLYGIPYVEDGVYLDTPANRRRLADYSLTMERLVHIRKTVHREHER